MSERRDLKRRARRKLTKNGNSVTIAVPREFLDWMHLLPGNEVDMVYDDEFEGFFVRAYERQTFRPPKVGAANV